MADITYEEKSVSDGRQKERYEWMRLWCDHTEITDLPRVLLIGDSINEGYQKMVRERLAGKVAVDYCSTSYGLDAPIYHSAVCALAGDTKYACIHFNFGLHAWHIDDGEQFERLYDRTVRELMEYAPLIIATTTEVRSGTDRRVCLRNEATLRVAARYGLPVDDLYPISRDMPEEMRCPDTVHLTGAGYELLADSVAASVLHRLGIE